jgi:hypothetical protein
LIYLFLFLLFININHDCVFIFIINRHIYINRSIIYWGFYLLCFCLFIILWLLFRLLICYFIRLLLLIYFINFNIFIKTFRKIFFRNGS